MKMNADILWRDSEQPSCRFR